MKIYLDCLPCVLRQVLEASRMATDNAGEHDRIMSDAIDILGRYKSYRISPEIVREIHRLVGKRTGILDPYNRIKQRDLQTALSIYPKLRSFVEKKTDRLYWALKVAATGNSLDSAVNTGYDIEESIENEMQEPFAACDAELFEQQLKTAERLLIIGDNAGETVFDRVLLEQLPNINLTYAVRSAPIINDATREDAQAAGLGRITRVISTGCDMPGVLLNECSKTFLDIFFGADIVISKGQGNFESLSDCDRDIYFLLKAKCPMISDLLGVGINEYVFEYKGCNREKAYL
jgi:uncharacterized protein with ATP-grasp and redox domains